MGVIEDVVILPQSGENDAVYFAVRRTVDGSEVRFLERMFDEDDCQGRDLNKQLDAAVVYDGAATNTITGLGHLEGEVVRVWADGGYAGEYTVSAGGITTPEAVAKAVVGLTYRARYKSYRTALQAASGSALGQRQRITRMGAMLRNTHRDGLQYGQSFDALDPMPDVEEGAVVPAGKVWRQYALDSFEFNGEWNTDSRLCLESHAPFPCTVLGAFLSVETNERR
jgi:hypothetical protein